MLSDNDTVMEKKISLNFVWGIRLKLWAEGNRLWDEGDRLWDEGSKLWDEGDNLRDEGSKLWAEGNKRMAEGDKLRAEGDKLWAEAILEACGNIKLAWTYENEKEICELETGEVFERDEAQK